MGSTNVRCCVTDIMIQPKEEVVLHVIWDIGNTNYSLPLYVIYNDYNGFVLNERLTDEQKVKQRISLSYLYMMFDGQIEASDRTVKIKEKFPTLEEFINNFEDFTRDISTEDGYHIGGRLRTSMMNNTSCAIDTSLKLFPVKQTVYYNIVSMDFTSRNRQRMNLESVVSDMYVTMEIKHRRQIELWTSLQSTKTAPIIEEVHKHYPEMWGSNEITEGAPYNIILKNLICMMAQCRILGEFLALTGRDWKYNHMTTQQENTDLQRELNKFREYELSKLDVE